jgi:hypothetical protein
MKNYVLVILMLAFGGAQAQSIVGTWQQVDEKTCMKSQFEESDTEKELLPGFGSTQNAVAKLIKFGVKGTGEEGIFSKGSKKGSAMNGFKYQINGQELLLLDKKSGIMTQRFIIDELSVSTLKIHNASKDCEIRSFSRIK